jgi:hypothetical protein
MPFGTAAAVFFAVAFAYTQDFSTQRSVVFADAAVAVMVFAFSVALLRLGAVRQERLELALAEGR